MVSEDLNHEKEISLPARYYWTPRLSCGLLMVCLIAAGLWVAWKAEAISHAVEIEVGMIALAIVGGVSLLRLFASEDSLRVTSKAISKMDFLGLVHRVQWSEINEVRVTLALTLHSPTDCVRINPFYFVDPNRFYEIVEDLLDWPDSAENKPLTFMQIRRREL